MLLLVEAAHLGRDDTAHHALHHLDHGDLQAELAQSGGALEADVAGADDGGARAGFRERADCVHIRDGAQHVDTSQIGAGHRQGSRVAADREDELVVGKVLAARERQPASRIVERHRRIAQDRLAVDAFVEGRVADRQAIGFHFARQKLLRQRRTLVRQFRFARDQHQPAGKAVAPQAVHGLCRGVAAPDDDDRVLHARAPPDWPPLYTGARRCGREWK
jgi:hypothetical protein